jgi:hypothetical protein
VNACTHICSHDIFISQNQLNFTSQTPLKSQAIFAHELKERRRKKRAQTGRTSLDSLLRTGATPDGRSFATGTLSVRCTFVADVVAVVLLYVVQRRVTLFLVAPERVHKFH